MSVHLIEALQQPDLFEHPVAQFEVIETHLSWVILTGSFAYKIKKGVNLGFQDFTTLEKRKFYCEQELKLNQRLAPTLYIDVVPITGTEIAPSFKNTGAPIEYAIKMHQFSQDNLLSQLADKHTLTLSMIDEIATQLAMFHQQAEVCLPDQPYGEPDEVFSPVQENFDVLRTLEAGKPYLTEISHIEQWANDQFNQHRSFMAKRKQTGWIRACHGDLHLGNIVLENGKPLIFDCIEFKESWRWTDVMNDLGFLAMDLDRFSAEDLSHYLINRYCEHTLDYEGVRLLEFYQCYRSMVRAKVTAFQLNLSHSDEQQKKLQQEFKQFLALATKYTLKTTPSLTITVGVSGSGKTFESQKLFMQTGAIRLRSDGFRLQLFPNPKERYTETATQQVYQTLIENAEMLLQAGYAVIIDAACLKQAQRKLFLNLANRLQVPFHILALDAPVETLRERIKQREKQGQDLSEATVDILEMQIKEKEPLSEDEIPFISHLTN